MVALGLPVMDVGLVPSLVIALACHHAVPCRPLTQLDNRMPTLEVTINLPSFAHALHHDIVPCAV